LPRSPTPGGQSATAIAGRRSGSHVIGDSRDIDIGRVGRAVRPHRPAAGLAARLAPDQELAPDLEGAALEQATNLSNPPFAINHVALMPEAHAGYGMPIGGVLFADWAVVPYAIGVDIGCGVTLVETGLTVETLGADGLKLVLGQRARDVPVGRDSQPKPVDRDAALAEIGLELPASVAAQWFDRAVNQLGTLGRPPSQRSGMADRRKQRIDRGERHGPERCREDQPDESAQDVLRPQCEERTSECSHDRRDPCGDDPARDRIWTSRRSRRNAADQPVGAGHVDCDGARCTRDDGRDQDGADQSGHSTPAVPHRASLAHRTPPPAAVCASSVEARFQDHERCLN